MHLILKQANLDIYHKFELLAQLNAATINA